MTEPSKTVREFAPHAAVCEVGVAQQPWTPDILTPADLAIPEVRFFSLYTACTYYVLYLVCLKN